VQALFKTFKLLNPEKESAMADKNNDGQSGGVNISGFVGSVGGDIIGRDKITGVDPGALDKALQPVSQAIETAAPEVRTQAEQKLTALKAEAAKGDAAQDETVAELVEGLVDLAPEATGAVVSAFGSPVLGGIVGAATKYILGKLRKKSA
jgi:hypothetical protein